MGPPFRCNRCHAYGNLIHDCSLSFNNKHIYVPKTKSVWRVKNDGKYPRDILDSVKGDSLEDISLHQTKHEDVLDS